MFVRLLILAIVGGICYFGYSTYREEAEKAARQRIQVQKDQTRIRNGYVDSIKTEVKKIATPTP